MSWKPSQKKRTRTVPRSRNTFGISVCVGKESTLKGTQTCNFQIKYVFYDLSSRIFWTDLVYTSRVTFIKWYVRIIIIRRDIEIPTIKEVFRERNNVYYLAEIHINELVGKAVQLGPRATGSTSVAAVHRGPATGLMSSSQHVDRDGWTGSPRS